MQGRIPEPKEKVLDTVRLPVRALGIVKDWTLTRAYEVLLRDYLVDEVTEI